MQKESYITDENIYAINDRNTFRKRFISQLVKHSQIWIALFVYFVVLNIGFACNTEATSAFMKRFIASVLIWAIIIEPIKVS